MSTTILHHFSEKPEPTFMAVTHEDSFGISVKQAGETDFFFDSPAGIKTHKESFEYLNGILNGMKRTLRAEYKEWQEKNK